MCGNWWQLPATERHSQAACWSSNSISKPLSVIVTMPSCMKALQAVRLLLAVGSSSI